MKKLLANIYIFISLLLVSIIAIPWNDFSVWGINISFLTTLTNNEVLIKASVLGFFVIVSLLFLFVSNAEYKKNEKVSTSSAYAVTFPLIGFVIAQLSYLTYMIYTDADLTLGIGISNLYSLYLIAGGVLIILSFIFLYVFTKSFRKRHNPGRTIYYFIFVIFAGLIGGLAYYFKTNEAINYSGMSAKYMALTIPVALAIYIITLIVIRRKNPETMFDEIDELNNEVDEIKVLEDGQIVTKQSKIDPNDNLYQEVKVDPEFSRQSKQRNQANSIDYYIEKPKMFKALNPNFDKLVNHVREFPDVIVKLDDEKITFYAARRPFLVLMNYGDYYRLAFRYELEEGIRLIIKYPTISKNKSTREELWFKANNYGDLPKELIYKIVKNAYDIVSR